MPGPGTLLARDSLVKWIRASGFLMVVLVALVPAGLTGAWVWTHTADVAITDTQIPPVTLGESVNLSATVTNVGEKRVGPFNVTFIGWFITQNAQGQVLELEVVNRTVRAHALDPGEDQTVQATWNTTNLRNFRIETRLVPLAGTFGGAVVADDLWSPELKESEPRNNVRDVVYVVNPPSFSPLFPANPLTPVPENATVPDLDVTIANLTLPDSLDEGDTGTFQVTVTNNGPAALDNASLDFVVGTFNQATNAITTRDLTEERRVDLAVNESRTYTFTYNGTGGRSGFAAGLFAAEATIDPNGHANDTAPANNARRHPFIVTAQPEPREVEEKATAKDFYRNSILLPVHFALLVPLIGLFYAGGVLQDDRSRGNLVYMLSRPVPRWQFPIVRFASSFGVALIAVVIGVVLTFLLLLGQPAAEPQYLWWPLAFGAIVLFLYGSVFTLVGVVSDRPYLVGLLYVLGFETLVLAGRRVVVNNQPLVQDWVLLLSLNNWVQKAFAGWDPSAGFRIPQGEAGTAFLVILAIGAASLVAAAILMQRREFGE